MPTERPTRDKRKIRTMARKVAAAWIEADATSSDLPWGACGLPEEPHYWTGEWDELEEAIREAFHHVADGLRGGG